MFVTFAMLRFHRHDMLIRRKSVPEKESNRAISLQFDSHYGQRLRQEFVHEIRVSYSTGIAHGSDLIWGVERILIIGRSMQQRNLCGGVGDLGP